jgi:hypothetical protein
MFVAEELEKLRKGEVLDYDATLQIRMSTPGEVVVAAFRSEELLTAVYHFVDCMNWAGTWQRGGDSPLCGTDAAEDELKEGHEILCTSFPASQLVGSAVLHRTLRDLGLFPRASLMLSRAPKKGAAGVFEDSRRAMAVRAVRAGAEEKLTSGAYEAVLETKRKAKAEDEAARRKAIMNFKDDRNMRKAHEEVRGV